MTTDTTSARRGIDPDHSRQQPVDLWEHTTPTYDADPTGSCDAPIAAAAATSASPYGQNTDHTEAEPAWIRIGAVAATALLLAAVIVFLVDRSGGAADVPAASPAPAPGAASAPSSMPANATEPPAALPASSVPTPTAPDVVAVVPTVGGAGSGEPAPAPAAGVQDPPPLVAPPVPPAPQPPAPAPLLAAQLLHELDPGVDGLTITLANDGDAPLTFSVAETPQVSVDTPSGEIAAGDTFDLWVELDIAPDGDGPTPFELPIDVTSNGGDLTIVVSGQVEKPGHLVADYADLPLVDHRGAVSFTNVGELPIEITGLDAPGLTTAPIPDEVAAGTTWELEIAICADTEIEPDLVWTTTEIGFRYDSWVTVETPTSESTTTVSSFDVGTPLPSCEPVIDPIDVITLEVALP